MKTADEVKVLIEECIKESWQMYSGSYREVCIGIEAMVTDLSKEEKTHVTRLVLDFYQDGVKLSEVDVVGKKPKNYHIEGLWTVLYSAVCPRYTPFGPEPLRVSRLEIGYDIPPRVSYDAEFDNGLPMALNRPYNPEKLKANASQ